jgi:hypothetical protein
VAEYSNATNPFSGTMYLTGDHLGSTRAVTNASGTVIARYDFAPFGEELSQGIDGRSAPYSNNSYPTATQDAVTQKFTGQERDSETGADSGEGETDSEGNANGIPGRRRTVLGA